MEVIRADGHLSDEALRALIQHQPLEELTRLEIAEHLAFCDRCLQHYTELLEDTALETPAHSCRETLWATLRRRTVHLLSQRYATAAAAVALALTLLWGSGSPAFLAAEEKIEAALGPQKETLQERWDDSMSDLSQQLHGLFDRFDPFHPSPKGDQRP